MKKLKRNLIRTLAFAASVLAAFPVASQGSKYSARHESIEAHFKGSAEPTAKDALWTSRNIFKVGVMDNGSNRDGYAQYVCNELYARGFKGERVWVQIIDIAKLVRTDKWVKLGEAHCQ